MTIPVCFAQAYERIREANGIWEGKWSVTDVTTAAAAPTCELRSATGSSGGDLCVREALYKQLAI